MKRIILFFAVCLGLSVSQTTFADTSDTVRAASRRTVSPTTTTPSNTSSATRSVSSSTKRASGNTSAQKNSRSTTQQKTVSRATTKPVVVQRTSTQSVQPNQNVTTRNSSSRNITSRAAIVPQSRVNTAVVRTATQGKKPTRTTVRAADLDSTKITDIKSLNYSKCKTVYYECMDEFCANKDSSLRRCACSSRIHEFDGIKKQLAAAEDKMLDFNQRLLTVSLDKEDAAAINVATEGELAFSKKDTTESEKLLQKITNALNTSGDSKINNNLSAISLSLDVDSAWDDIDSLSGVATSAKSGLDLYNAARPICIEMAREVCNDEELDIAQSGYKLSIQQDCNTVAKSYNTQYNNAMNKIHESGALLDMSRLNIYQQRNSDDTLTCRKKILDQLSDTTVCGENLYKCLDTTGKYIDPSNGSAFLSEDLYELTNLLTAPETGEKWSTSGRNESFVKFLNSKKEFLKPATEQCRDISDMIWKDFLDDALAQIKLAQNAKLEEIRRSCTTLVAECKTSALESLSDFDARALSTFSVAADKTANAMCSEITNSCTKLMASSDAAENWKTGMAGLLSDETKKNIIDGCMNVGRNCITNQCGSASGNFALCQDITSETRIKILNKSACYEEVKNCIANADNMTQTTGTRITLNENGEKLLADIWGNDCSSENDKEITSESTLLAWFATNTGENSCSTTGCESGYALVNGVCKKSISEDTSDCKTAEFQSQIIAVADGITNYCENGIRDRYGNCCVSGASSNGVCVPSGYQAARLQNLTCTKTDDYLCHTTGNMVLYCVTNLTSQKPITYYADYAEYECGEDGNGIWVVVDENGKYFNPDSSSTKKPIMYYKNINNGSTCPTDEESLPSTTTCEYLYESGNWSWTAEQECDAISGYPTNNELLIEYNTGN